MANYVVLILVALACLGTLEAFPQKRDEASSPQWEICGDSPDQYPIKVHELEISPMPVLFPGDVTLTLRAEVTRNISNMDVKTKIKRYVTLLGYSYPITVPCVSGFGSCEHKDMRSELQKFMATAHNMKHADIALELMKEADLTPSFPIQPHTITLRDHKVNIPEVTNGVVAAAMEGDHGVELQLIDPDTKETLLCFSLRVSLKRYEEPKAEKACTGFWCGLGK